VFADVADCRNPQNGTGASAPSSPLTAERACFAKVLELRNSILSGSMTGAQVRLPGKSGRPNIVISDLDVGEGTATFTSCRYERHTYMEPQVRRPYDKFK